MAEFVFTVDQFHIRNPHLTQIPFSSSYETNNSLWGLIWRRRGVMVQLVLQFIQFYRNFVYMLAGPPALGKVLFFFAICVLFFQIAPISLIFISLILCIILNCDCFFPPQDSRWMLRHAHPKIYSPRPFQLIFASLVALGGFCPVTTTKVTAYWTHVCSDVSVFYPLLRICARSHLNYAAILPLCALNVQLVVVFGIFLRNATPISHIAFSYAKVRAKYSSRILKKYLWCQLSALHSLWCHPKQYGDYFFCFL